MKSGTFKYEWTLGLCGIAAVVLAALAMLIPATLAAELAQWLARFVRPSWAGLAHELTLVGVGAALIPYAVGAGLRAVVRTFPDLAG